MGENGLIRQAERAGEHHANGVASEQDAIDTLLEQYANAMSGEGSVGGNGNNGGGQTPTGTTLVAMYNTAKTANCTGESCTDPDNHLHIGDYVNYQNPTSGTKTVLATDSGIATAGTKVGNQTFEITEEKNQLTLRVLGIDETTGGIKLIAGSPMKTNRFDTIIPILYYTL